MKRLVTLLIGAFICTIHAGCGESGNNAVTPQELHESCIAVFERKGGPAELAERMCDSMRQACESDPSGEDCEKARRIVAGG